MFLFFSCRAFFVPFVVRNGFLCVFAPLCEIIILATNKQLRRHEFKTEYPISNTEYPTDEGKAEDNESHGTGEKI